MGTQTTVPCAQAEDSGLVSPLQSPNWVKVCLVSTVFFLPVSIVPGMEKCLGLSVCDREPDCRFLQVCLLFRFLSVPHEQATLVLTFTKVFYSEHKAVSSRLKLWLNVDRKICWLVGCRSLLGWFQQGALLQQQ